MNVVCDNKRRAVIPGAQPGDCFAVEDLGGTKVFHLLKSVPPAVAPGKLVPDQATGLKLWDGDLGEDDADAVIRNRAHDQ